ncbi:hypothetical protein EYF80_046813 [Liparis tanakae]|uniref:Uncharacterized protein n=1 Tax=Liparis tanakae TaxID=230148 RepID=A0A4Z2FRI6_9TELE|nr:hypothetical protein EYF80_046813 [Liparis tanakae]
MRPPTTTIPDLTHVSSSGPSRLQIYVRGPDGTPGRLDGLALGSAVVSGSKTVVTRLLRPDGTPLAARARAITEEEEEEEEEVG